MKKILSKTRVKYLSKCPYCDCEFEYEPDDIFIGDVRCGAAVTCPNCHNVLNHKDSWRSNITTESL